MPRVPWANRGLFRLLCPNERKKADLRRHIARRHCATSTTRQAARGDAADDERVGIDIVDRALAAPVRQIVENAGEVPSVVLQKIIDANETNFGFNALTREYGDIVVMAWSFPPRLNALRWRRPRPLRLCY